VATMKKRKICVENTAGKEGELQVCPADTDILTLNMMGEESVQVLRRTLTLVPGSMLAAMFSGKWHSASCDSKGRIFLNHSPKIFRPLIEFLQAKEIELPGFERSSPSEEDFESPQLFRDFLGMVEYYGLTEAMYPIRIVPLSFASTDAPFPFVSKGVRFQHEQVQYFYVESSNPDYCITSFEFVVEKNASNGYVFFGWADPSRMHAWPKLNLGTKKKAVKFETPTARIILKCTMEDAKYVVPSDPSASRQRRFSSISRGQVAVFGGKGTWRLTDVTLSEICSTNAADHDAEND